MQKSSLIFCVGALTAALAIAVFAFPFAALPQATVAQAGKAVAAEALGVVHVGGGFGNVPVTKLMDYYISHPPAKVVTSAPAAPKLRFGGC